MMTPKETTQAIYDALTFLESLGYVKGGDIHDGLAAALREVERLVEDNKYLRGQLFPREA